MNRWFWIAATAFAFGVLAGARETNSAAQNTAAPATNNAFVLGQVVDVGTGRPIPEATVSVTVRGGGPAIAAPGGAGIPLTLARAGGAPGSSTVRLLTGSDGRFVLRDLPRSALTITATAAGYVAGSAGQARPLGPTRPIDLDAGEHLTDLTIRLWKNAIITGTVVDEHGEPAVGVTVRALRQAFVNGKPQYQPGSLARTDDRGVYRISAITPGPFLVIVPQTVMTMPTAMMDTFMQSFAGSAAAASGLMDIAAAGGAPPNTGMSGVRIGDAMVASQTGPLPPGVGDRVSVYRTEYFPADAAIAPGRAFTLGSGEEKSGVDFQLRVLPGYRVSGTLTSANGPVTGVQVRLVPQGRLDYSGTTGNEAGTTMAAPDGTFRLMGIPAGQYVLSAAKPASRAVPAEMANNPMLSFTGMSAGGQPVTLFGQTPLTVDNGDVAGIALNLVEGAKVSGRIEFSGGAAPPSETALRAMSVTLTPVDGRGVAAGSIAGPPRLDANGQFTTIGYPPGRYNVLVAPAPGPAWRLTSVTTAGRDILETGIDLGPVDLNGVVITYSDRVTSISGTARASAGAASKTATIVAFPVDYETWIATGMSMQRSRTVVASKAGAFSLVALPAGDYLVAALDDADLGDSRDPAVIMAIAPRATRVTLTEGEKRAIDLRLVKPAAR